MPNVARADVSVGQEEIGHRPTVQAAQGNAVEAGQWRIVAGTVGRIHAVGSVQIDRPAAIGDDVAWDRVQPRQDVVLGQ
ncbi:MAG TPA: hypothetical protein VMW65_14520 [Chloroflexota bacterium]|nr:hypothetical protein [Chloroflexota bacterium]